MYSEVVPVEEEEKDGSMQMLEFPELLAANTSAQDESTVLSVPTLPPPENPALDQVGSSKGDEGIASLAQPQGPKEEEPTCCRICFDEEPPLERFCNCTGSIGYFHKPCLETWLSTRDQATCEICSHEYNVATTVFKSFKCEKWATIPRRQHIHSAIMLVIVTFCCGYFIALCFEDATQADLFSIVAIFVFFVIFLLASLRILKTYVFLLTEVKKETVLLPMSGESAETPPMEKDGAVANSSLLSGDTSHPVPTQRVTN